MNFSEKIAQKLYDRIKNELVEEIKIIQESEEFIEFFVKEIDFKKLAIDIIDSNIEQFDKLKNKVQAKIIEKWENSAFINQVYMDLDIDEIANRVSMKIDEDLLEKLVEDMESRLSDDLVEDINLEQMVEEINNHNQPDITKKVSKEIENELVADRQDHYTKEEVFRNIDLNKVLDRAIKSAKEQVNYLLK